MDFDLFDFLLSALTFFIGIGIWFHREANKINSTLRVICDRLGDLETSVGNVSRGLTGFKSDIDRDHRGHDDEIRTETKEIHEHMRGMEKKFEEGTGKLTEKVDGVQKDVTYLKARMNGKGRSD